MIAENKEKYISFSFDVAADLYNALGKVKEKKFSLDSFIALGSWQAV